MRNAGDSIFRTTAGTHSDSLGPGFGRRVRPGAGRGAWLRPSPNRAAFAGVSGSWSKIASVAAIFLSTFVPINQNRVCAAAEKRAEEITRDVAPEAVLDTLEAGAEGVESEGRLIR